MEILGKNKTKEKSHCGAHPTSISCNMIHEEEKVELKRTGPRLLLGSTFFSSLQNHDNFQKDKSNPSTSPLQLMDPFPVYSFCFLLVLKTKGTIVFYLQFCPRIFTWFPRGINLLFGQKNTPGSAIIPSSIHLIIKFDFFIYSNSFNQKQVEIEASFNKN